MTTSLQHVYLRPGFLLKRCHQVTAALFLDHCREFGVTPSQYGALRALEEFPGIDQLAVGRLIGLDVDPHELPRTEARLRVAGFGPDGGEDDDNEWVNLDSLKKATMIYKPPTRAGAAGLLISMTCRPA